MRWKHSLSLVDQTLPSLPFPFPADQEVTVKPAAMVRQVIGNKLGSQHTVVGKYAPP